MTDLSISIIDTPERWQQLAEEWPPLLESSACGSFFLTWEWQSAWAESYLDDNRSLFVLIVREKESLVGVAPFYVHRRKHGPLNLRELRLLGSPEAGSDYLDVISRRGREKAVADAVYEFLTGAGGDAWDLIHLQDIPSDSLFLLHLMKRVEIDGKYAEMAQGSYCPIVEIPQTDEELMARLSPGTRKKFKQDVRVLHRVQGVVHSVIQGDEVSERLGEFFRLYEKKGVSSAEGLQTILRIFLEKCSAEKPVQLDLLSIEGRTVAGLLHFKYQNTLAMYLMAVDKSFNPKISLGNLLVGLCLKNSIEAGHSAYDFLKGDESYKFHWATGGKTSVQFFLWQRQPVALVSGLNRLLRHTGKLILR